MASIITVARLLSKNQSSFASHYPLLSVSRYLISHNVENRQYLALPRCASAPSRRTATSSFTMPAPRICSRDTVPEATETEGRPQAFEAILSYTHSGHRVPRGESRSDAERTQLG